VNVLSTQVQDGQSSGMVFVGADAVAVKVMEGACIRQVPSELAPVTKSSEGEDDDQRRARSLAFRSIPPTPASLSHERRFGFRAQSHPASATKQAREI
jgi:hypothetical protein